MLLDDTKVELAENGLRTHLSPKWEIWGPNGGYLAAIALRAVATVVPAGHRPASISCQFLASGKMEDARVKAAPVKMGRSAWCVDVEILQNERILLRAQVWTTDRKDGPHTPAPPMPRVPEPLSLPTYADLNKGRKPHLFWTNFDARPITLPVPTDEPVEPMLQHWFRFPDVATDDPFADQGRTVIPIDTVPWPTHWRTRPRTSDYMGPSLDLSIWFHDVPGKSEWQFLETHSDVAGGGLIFGRARMWADDGRLLATGASHMLHSPARTS